MLYFLIYDRKVKINNINLNLKFWKFINILLSNIGFKEEIMNLFITNI